MSWIPPKDWKSGRRVTIAYIASDPDATLDTLDDILAVFTEDDLRGELERRASL